MLEYYLSHFDSPIKTEGEVFFLLLSVLLQKIKIQEWQIKHSNPDLIPSCVKSKFCTWNLKYWVPTMYKVLYKHLNLPNNALSKVLLSLETEAGRFI